MGNKKTIREGYLVREESKGGRELNKWSGVLVRRENEGGVRTNREGYP